MKNLLFLAILLLFSCGSNQDNAEEAALDAMENMSEIYLNGNYTIKELNSRNIASQRIVLKFDSLNNIVAGNAGCNRFSSSYIHTKDSLSFNDPVSTKMYCEGKMELEQEIISVLPQISALTKNSEQLVFFSANNERLLTLQKQD